MEFFASPALLGGIVACFALGGWTLGRCQSGAVPAHDALMPEQIALHPPFEWRAPASHDRGAVSPGRQAARSERQVALDTAPPLGQLHAEISAYRQQAQVFAGVAEGEFATELALAVRQHECRYLGLIGQPTCGMPQAALPACDCSGDCAAGSVLLRAAVAVQPSPADCLTRV